MQQEKPKQIQLMLWLSRISGREGEQTDIAFLLLSMNLFFCRLINVFTLNGVNYTNLSPLSRNTLSWIRLVYASLCANMHHFFSAFPYYMGIKMRRYVMRSGGLE